MEKENNFPDVNSLSSASRSAYVSSIL